MSAVEPVEDIGLGGGEAGEYIVQTAMYAVEGGVIVEMAERNLQFETK